MATFVNIEVASNNNQVFVGASNGSMLFYAQSNTQRMLLGPSNLLVPPLSIINSTGRIGIFNSNPQFPLDINGSIRIHGTSNAFRPTRQNSNVGVISQFGATNLTDGNSTGLFIGKNTSLYNGFEINYVQKGNSTPSNLLTITPSGQFNRFGLAIAASGYVGIGTSNPLYHLDTSNNIRVGSNAIVTPNRPFMRGELGANNIGLINLTSIQSSGGMVVTSANRLVAPITGLYKISFSSITMNSSSRNDITIYVNGVTVANTLSEDNGSGWHYRCASIAYYLNANDYVQFYANQGYTYNGTGGGEYAWRTFTFYFVG